jgi:hypothetical protein
MIVLIVARQKNAVFGERVLPANNFSKMPMKTIASSSANSLLFPRSMFSDKENHYIKGFREEKLKQMKLQHGWLCPKSA